MEIFNILGKLGVQGVDEAREQLDNTSGAAKGLSGVLSKVGDGLAVMGKAVVAGVAAGATAVGALAKASLDSYADFEQLVGGVETLFGESAGIVKDYAAQAYESAGMSANEYMETVTGFSASLLQSLGGNTELAAEVADRAIRDMSDNANKMGTDISAIQNAYQGFAKQNYTMLDNLKLGYGGTKEEMERLIKDANKLKKAHGEAADLTIKSYADVIEAIGLVQDEMGITGTTAAEASKTISGSVAAMKSSWSNLVTGIADENANLGELIDSFVETALTAADNIIPRLEAILEGIGELVVQLAPIIAEQIPVLLESLLPSLIEAAVGLISSLLTSALPQLLAIITDQLPFIIEQISIALVEVFPILLETLKGLFGQIWDYISLELLNTGVSFEDTFAAIQVVVEGAWTVLQTLWSTIGQPVWDLVQSCIATVEGVFSEKMPEIEEFVSNCFTDIQNFWTNNLEPCLEAIGDFIENTLAPAFEYVFNEVVGPVVDGAFSLIEDLWNNTLMPVFTGITDFLTGVFTGDWDLAWNGIVDIVDGVFSGIITAVQTPINTVIGIVNNFISGLNNLSIPDWVPVVGGKGINIPLIPMLEKGGILEKGQVGFLEGTGAEAVVPLDRNKAWVNAVANDMEVAIGGGNKTTEILERILDALLNLDDGMQEKLTDAFGTMKFDVNNREFARMVKAVN